MIFNINIKSNPIGINIIGCINIIIGLFFLLIAIAFFITNIQEPQPFIYIFLGSLLWLFIWPVLFVWLGLSLLQLKDTARRFQVYTSLVITLISSSLLVSMLKLLIIREITFPITLISTHLLVITYCLFVITYLTLSKTRKLFHPTPVISVPKRILIFGRSLQIIGIIVWIFVLFIFVIATFPIPGGADEAESINQFRNATMLIFIVSFFMATTLSVSGSRLIKRKK